MHGEGQPYSGHVDVVGVYVPDRITADAEAETEVGLHPDGKKALEARKATERRFRATRLTQDEKAFLRERVTYEGVAYHKRNPGDFGLTPPAAPRLEKTLCDEAGISQRAIALGLLQTAIDAGLVSDDAEPGGFPKHLWVVDGQGHVFEAAYGGSRTGCYHGYPIRKTDLLFKRVIKAWRQ